MTQQPNVALGFHICIQSVFQTRHYIMRNNMPLGDLLLIKVENDPISALSEWYCSKIVVRTPEGEVLLFPCYRWLARGAEMDLRGGRGDFIFNKCF